MSDLDDGSGSSLGALMEGKEEDGLSGDEGEDDMGFDNMDSGMSESTDPVAEADEDEESDEVPTLVGRSEPQGRATTSSGKALARLHEHQGCNSN